MIADYKTIVLDGDLSLDLAFDGELSLDAVIDGESGVVTEVIKSDYEYYSGATTVNPDFVGTVLETAQKILLDDVTINPIEVVRTSNPQGGKTVYIGGII